MKAGAQIGAVTGVEWRLRSQHLVGGTQKVCFCSVPETEDCATKKLSLPKATTQPPLRSTVAASMPMGSITICSPTTLQPDLVPKLWCFLWHVCVHACTHVGNGVGCVHVW